MAPPDDLLFETLSAFSPDAFTAPPLDALRLATFAAPLIESAAPLEALILAEVAFTSLNDIAAPLDASASTVFAVSPFILAAAPLEASKSNEPAVSDAMEIAPPLDMSISIEEPQYRQCLNTFFCGWHCFRCQHPAGKHFKRRSAYLL